MKRIYIHIIVSATLTLAACDKEYAEPEAGNVAPVFTATIDGAQSRALNSAWEADDKIGITCSAASATNACYVTSTGDGTFTPDVLSQKIFFGSTSSSSVTNTWTFYAYYPWAPWTSTSNSTITESTSNQTRQKFFDFLFASAKGTKDAPEVKFEFVHKMSRVTLVFKDGQGYQVSNIQSYSLTKFYLDGTFKNTHTSSAACAATTETSSTLEVDLSEVEPDIKDGELVSKLILFPQTVPLSGITQTDRSVILTIISNDGNIFTVNLTFPNNKLAEGTNYTFTITVNKAGPVVNGSTITNWENYEWPAEGGGTDAADSADDPEED